MIIIIGLGNPGKKFENTRHNVGFMVLDKFAEKNNFPEFKLQKKYSAEISERNFGEQTLLLVKPQNYMNKSGEAAKKIIKKYRIGKFNENLKEPYGEQAMKIENCIVVHDDIDLPIGKIKIAQNRGSAGHKGVESIIKELKTKGFTRLRIGINPEHSYAPTRRSSAEKFVLQKFTKDEQKILDKTISKTADALDFILKEGLDKSMNEFNK